MRNTVDLTTPNIEGEYAIYLPALSTFYLRQLTKTIDPSFYGTNRLPATFDKGFEGMDFLKDDGYYNYKWALYSAGHAYLDINKGKEKEKMIQERDRSNTVIIGDSSGFQVAKGTGHFRNFSWDNFANKEGDKLRAKILHWLEETADWSMTFDVPAMSAEPPCDANTGLKTFQETLDYSLLNLEYFIHNRTPGKTKFLNVLSGSSQVNSKTWYEAVKIYSTESEVTKMGLPADHTMEGYAFAGINRMHMKTALERILDLKNDGLLEGKDWIHFLGIGRLDWACYLTAIQRQIRKHYNPNLTISFDAASPFVAVAKGLTYTHNVFTPKRWGYNMEAAIDEKSLKGSALPFPFQSPITERMTVGDICRYDTSDVNKQGKSTKTSWDSASYLILMAHNVYNHIAAVQEANRLVDYELSRTHMQNICYTDWTKEKRSSNANELSPYVPGAILFFNKFIEELLDPANPDPYAMLDANKTFLDTISFGGKDVDMFKELFNDVEDNPEEDYASLDDEDLMRLEGEDE